MRRVTLRLKNLVVLILAACSVASVIALNRTTRSLDEQGASPGRMIGCVRDGAGTLPGVGVTAVNTEQASHVVTDAKGCYTLSGLQPGTYVVEAKLAGFRAVRREGVAVRSGDTTRIDILMCANGFVHIDWVVPSSYAELLSEADAVVHLRITATRTDPDCGDVWTHTAHIITLLKAPDAIRSNDTIEFDQQRSTTEMNPYPIGMELVLPLSIGPKRNVRVAGPFGVYVVQQHIARSAMPSSFGAQYDGRELRSFLNELRKLTR